MYFTEVKNIPSTDLATIERLWTKFSGGKFGYSVQKVRYLDLSLTWNVRFDANLYTCLTHSIQSVIHRTIYWKHIKQKKYKQSKENFETFCTKIGWTTKDGDVERKKRWFGASEFIYDVKKAPEGHLPLTSALRGTSLIKELLNHPVWDNEDWKKEP